MEKDVKPHVAVVGAGAVGSLVGGILAGNGENVTLIAKKTHVETIRERGLSITGAAGDFTVAVLASEKLDFHPDLVFLAVKTQDIRATCEQIKPFVTGIPIVLMQNGVVASEIASEILGRENIVGCTVLFNAQFLEPGRVFYAKQNPCVVGRVFGDNDDRVKEICTLLNRVTRTELSDNILGVQWSKLLINGLGNALDGMTGLPLGEYVRYRAMRRIGVSLLKEALGLLRTAGIKLEPLPGLPLKAFITMISLPTPIAAWLLKFVMRANGDDSIVTSTLQSLRKAKPTEIDYLNGEFVRLGKQIGRPTPYNGKIVELIHEVERTGSFSSPEELSEIFSNVRTERRTR